MFWNGFLPIISVLATTLIILPTIGETKHSNYPWKCHKCNPGYFVAQKCGSFTETRCAPCPAGTYTNHFNRLFRCKRCSTCPAGHRQQSPCNREHDTKCVISPFLKHLHKTAGLQGDQPARPDNFVTEPTIDDGSGDLLKDKQTGFSDIFKGKNGTKFKYSDIPDLSKIEESEEESHQESLQEELSGDTPLKPNLFDMDSFEARFMGTNSVRSSTEESSLTTVTVSNDTTTALLPEKEAQIDDLIPIKKNIVATQLTTTEGSATSTLAVDEYTETMTEIPVQPDVAESEIKEITTGVDTQSPLNPLNSTLIVPQVSDVVTKSVVDTFNELNEPVKPFSPVPNISEITDTTEAEITTVEPSASTTGIPLVSESITAAPSPVSESTTVEPSSVAESTTAEPSSVAESTTVEPSSVAESTTVEPSSVAESTTAEPSSVAESTTAEPSSVAESTTVEPSSVAESTTAELPSVAESTTVEPPSVAESTTVEPSSVAESTTAEPSSVAESTTIEPSSVAESTTIEPSSVAESTTVPTSSVSVSSTDTPVDLTTTFTEPEVSTTTEEPVIGIDVGSEIVSAEKTDSGSDGKEATQVSTTSPAVAESDVATTTITPVSTVGTTTESEPVSSTTVIIKKIVVPSGDTIHKGSVFKNKTLSEIIPLARANEHLKTTTARAEKESTLKDFDVISSAGDSVIPIDLTTPEQTYPWINGSELLQEPAVDNSQSEDNKHVDVAIAAVITGIGLIVLAVIGVRYCVKRRSFKDMRRAQERLRMQMNEAKDLNRKDSQTDDSFQTAIYDDIELQAINGGSKHLNGKANGHCKDSNGSSPNNEIMSAVNCNYRPTDDTTNILPADSTPVEDLYAIPNRLVISEPAEPLLNDNSQSTEKGEKTTIPGFRLDILDNLKYIDETTDEESEYVPTRMYLRQAAEDVYSSAEDLLPQGANNLGAIAEETTPMLRRLSDDQS